MKESQRKGFCSRHLSDKKEPKTSRSSSNSRPPSSVASDVTTTPIPPSPHMSTLTAQERDAASVLMSLKNTPSRSATPASGRPSQIIFIKFLIIYMNSLFSTFFSGVCIPPLTPGLYSTSPSPVGNRGMSPARRFTPQVGYQPLPQQPCGVGRSSITPTHNRNQSFRTPGSNRIDQTNDSGLESLGKFRIFQKFPKLNSIIQVRHLIHTDLTLARQVAKGRPRRQ